MLANPVLSADEIAIIDENDDLLKKGALGLISLMLSGHTVNPQLKLDKSIKIDQMNHLGFKLWSYKCEDTPSDSRRLIFTNENKADLVFNVQVNGDFEIIKSKTNSGAKHPMAT